RVSPASPVYSAAAVDFVATGRGNFPFSSRIPGDCFRKPSKNEKPRESTRGYLKSRNHRLFLQSTPATALKILGIHQGFLRFLPCICLLLVENSSISWFSETPWGFPGVRLQESIYGSIRSEISETLPPQNGWEHWEDRRFGWWRCRPWHWQNGKFPSVPHSSVLPAFCRRSSVCRQRFRRKYRLHRWCRWFSDW